MPVSITLNWLCDPKIADKSSCWHFTISFSLLEKEKVEMSEREATRSVATELSKKI
jgi:hypothetical protein